MFTLIANIPIFRRLLYAFLLAAVAPGIVIGILGIVFLYLALNAVLLVEPIKLFGHVFHVPQQLIARHSRKPLLAAFRVARPQGSS